MDCHLLHYKTPLCFGVWSESVGGNAEGFCRSLKRWLPDKTEVCGVRVCCQDGTVRYVVVVENESHWMCWWCQLKQLRRKKPGGLERTKCLECYPYVDVSKEWFMQRLKECCAGIGGCGLFGTPFAGGLMSDWRLSDVLVGR